MANIKLKAVEKKFEKKSKEIPVLKLLLREKMDKSFAKSLES